MRIAAILAAVVFGFASFTARAEQVRPHLVIFISDDHGYLDSSAAGSREFRTPNLERLARDGMTFTQAFAASPSCAPSRAALLTGLMPMRNGAMLNHQAPRDDVKKLPAYLQDLHYEVVAFGKVAHYKQGKDYGFDHVSHDTFHDDDCVRAATEYLRQRTSDGPLCLLVGTNWPHVPWPEPVADSAGDRFSPPPGHVDTPETRHWRARYAAAVERFDRDLGSVYDAAYKRLGENTLFIHFSDHGAQWPFGKWNLYDAGTRVPFIVTWPGVIERGSKSQAMISLVDVLPTLLDAAGGEPGDLLDGRSFIDVLRGRSPKHRDRIFTTHSGDGRMNAYPIRSVRTRDWKYIRNLKPDDEHTTHIDGGESVDGNAYWQSWIARAKNDPDAARIVARYHRRPPEELYDLGKDPHEEHNLAAESSGLLIGLRGELDTWMRLQGENGLAAEHVLRQKSK